MGWHIKDGFRNTAQTGTWTGGPPESGGAPYFQTFQRTPTFTDAVVSGEGDLGAGPVAGHPNADPDEPGFKYMFENLKARTSASTSSRATAARPDHRAERRSRAFAAPREGVRSSAPLLASEQP